MLRSRKTRLYPPYTIISFCLIIPLNLPVRAHMKKLLLLLTLLLTPFAISAKALTLNSTSFTELSDIDPMYTCDGKNISPELDWSNIPKQTVSFTLLLSDPDAPNGTFYHWVLFNIPKNINKLPENLTQLPAETLIGNNSWGKAEYNGPCPPKGKPHNYVITLYALDTKLDLPAGAEVKTLLDAMQNHILDIAEIKSTFKH